jgi:hypothetical protein
MVHTLRMFWPTESEGLEYLLELASDLHLAWDRPLAVIWEQLDSELWALTHNPASGTSGMKVLANGGLNLSELDG